MTEYKIPLSQGKFVLVDEDDYIRLSFYKWYCTAVGYAARALRDPITKKAGVLYMHREIAQTPKGMHTDHINGDRLDNRKNNLRVCTNAENRRNAGKYSTNTSGYKGVVRNGKKWAAIINYNGTRKHLGVFTTPEDAHEFYCLAADMLYGDFANHG